MNIFLQRQKCHLSAPLPACLILCLFSGRYDTQNNDTLPKDTLHNDTLHNDSSIMLSVA
jgi:hypothetical protein